MTTRIYKIGMASLTASEVPERKNEKKLAVTGYIIQLLTRCRAAVSSFGEEGEVCRSEGRCGTPDEHSNSPRSNLRHIITLLCHFTGQCHLMQSQKLGLSFPTSVT